jgi:hypothetical protein
MAFAMTILTPKVYMIMSCNLKMLGIEDEPDQAEFIKKNINIISMIIRYITSAVIT